MINKMATGQDDNKVNDNIIAFEERVKLLENKLSNEAENWSKKITKITFNLRGDVKLLVDVQADIASYKQLILDDVRKYSLILYKDMPGIKAMKKARFEFYSTKYPIVVKSSTDKKGLIEADIAKIQYKIDLLETHIDFLRESGSNLETLSYSVKNRIQLLDILGLG